MYRNYPVLMIGWNVLTVYGVSVVFMIELLKKSFALGVSENQQNTHKDQNHRTVGRRKLAEVPVTPVGLADQCVDPQCKQCGFPNVDAVGDHTADGRNDDEQRPVGQNVLEFDDVKGLSLKSGISKLSGSVYKRIKEIRDEIIYEIAHIESALDDPEHISLDNYSEEIRNKIDKILKELTKLSDSTETGRIIRNGIKTVIVGKPNVGKSSVMNVLLGEDRAIVTDIEGTTRDSIEEGLKLGNINLRLIDTAGIRNSEDIIENIGIEKSITLCNDADLILFVIDSSRELDDNDIKIIKMTENKKMIILLNKTDKDMVVSEEDIDKLMSERENASSTYHIIPVSAKENIGFDELSNVAESLFIDTNVINSNEVIITNLRHKANIDDAILSLNSVINSIELGMPEDFYTIDMMGAYTSLGYIIGEEVDDDLVNEIFSKFCMGK